MEASLGQHRRRRALRAPKEALSEAQRLMALATTASERASVAGFLAALYAARVAPFDTYGCTRRVSLRGHTWHLGVRTSEIYILEEVYAQAMYDRIPAYIPERGWFVVDAGANAGVFTVTAAARGAQLIAIEPNHECFERLVRNAHDNHLGAQVQPVHAALGDHSGAAAMVVQRGGTTGGQAVDPDSAVADAAAPWVRLCTLDELVADADIQRVDLLKMDIEGAEVSALRGAERTLACTQRIIYEYHSVELLAGMRSTLERHGFREDLQFVYYPEGTSEDGEEVGMVYASRPGPGRCDQPA